MKFKLTKRVKIGGTVFSVKKMQLNEKEARDGFIGYWTQEIRIDQNVNQIDALLHEITHGVGKYLAVNLSEDWVDRISAAHRMLIADNPALFRHLADVLGGGK
jgi:hypothetical protein